MNLPVNVNNFNVFKKYVDRYINYIDDYFINKYIVPYISNITCLIYISELKKLKNKTIYKLLKKNINNYNIVLFCISKIDVNILKCINNLFNDCNNLQIFNLFEQFTFNQVNNIICNIYDANIFIYFIDNYIIKYNIKYNTKLNINHVNKIINNYNVINYIIENKLNDFSLIDSISICSNLSVIKLLNTQNIYSYDQILNIISASMTTDIFDYLKNYYDIQITNKLYNDKCTLLIAKLLFEKYNLNISFISVHNIYSNHKIFKYLLFKHLNIIPFINIEAISFNVKKIICEYNYKHNYSYSYISQLKSYIFNNLENYHVLKLFLSNGLNPNIYDIYDKTLVTYYINNFNFLKLLIKHKLDINESCNINNDLIISYCSNIKCMNLIVKSFDNININHKNINGLTCLMINNNIDVLNIILNIKNININETDKNGCTALMHSKTIEKINLLLKYNADINIRDNKNQSIFYYITNPLIQNTIIKYYLKNNNVEKILEKDNNGCCLLHYKLSYPCFMYIMNIVKKNNININMLLNNKNQSILFNNLDNFRKINLLINNKIDLNIIDIYKRNVLYYTNNIKYVELLLKNKTNVNNIDIKNKTPLIYYCIKKINKKEYTINKYKYNLIALFIKYNANLNIIYNKNPLFFYFINNYDILSLFANNNVDFNKLNEDNLHILEYEFKYINNNSIIELLLKNKMYSNVLLNNIPYPFNFMHDTKLLEIFINHGMGLSYLIRKNNNTLSILTYYLFNPDAFEYLINIFFNDIDISSIIDNNNVIPILSYNSFINKINKCTFDEFKRLFNLFYYSLKQLVIDIFNYKHKNITTSILFFSYKFEYYTNKYLYNDVINNENKIYDSIINSINKLFKLGYNYIFNQKYILNKNNKSSNIYNTIYNTYFCIFIEKVIKLINIMTISNNLNRLEYKALIYIFKKINNVVNYNGDNKFYCNKIIISYDSEFYDELLKLIYLNDKINIIKDSINSIYKTNDIDNLIKSNRSINLSTINLDDYKKNNYNNYYKLVAHNSFFFKTYKKIDFIYNELQTSIKNTPFINWYIDNNNLIEENNKNIRINNLDIINIFNNIYSINDKNYAKKIVNYISDFIDFKKLKFNKIKIINNNIAIKILLILINKGLKLDMNILMMHDFSDKIKYISYLINNNYMIIDYLKYLLSICYDKIYFFELINIIFNSSYKNNISFSFYLNLCTRYKHDIQKNEKNVIEFIKLCIEYDIKIFESEYSFIFETFSLINSINIYNYGLDYIFKYNKITKYDISNDLILKHLILFSDDKLHYLSIKYLLFNCKYDEILLSNINEIINIIGKKNNKNYLLFYKLIINKFPCKFEKNILYYSFINKKLLNLLNNNFLKSEAIYNSDKILRFSNYNVIKYFLNKYNIFFNSSLLNSFLHYYKNDYKLIKLLIKNNADINTLNEYNENILFTTTSHHVVNYILTKTNININQINNDNKTIFDIYYEIYDDKKSKYIGTINILKKILKLKPIVDFDKYKYVNFENTFDELYLYYLKNTNNIINKKQFYKYLNNTCSFKNCKYIISNNLIDKNIKPYVVIYLLYKNENLHIDKLLKLIKLFLKKFKINKYYDSHLIDIIKNTKHEKHYLFIKLLFKYKIIRSITLINYCLDNLDFNLFNKAIFCCNNAQYFVDLFIVSFINSNNIPKKYFSKYVDIYLFILINYSHINILQYLFKFIQKIKKIKFFTYNFFKKIFSLNINANDYIKFINNNICKYSSYEYLKIYDLFLENKLNVNNINLNSKIINNDNLFKLLLTYKMDINRYIYINNIKFNIILYKQYNTQIINLISNNLISNNLINNMLIIKYKYSCSDILLMVNNGLDLNYKDDNGNTFLHVHVYDIYDILSFISYNFNINSVNNNGNTIIHENINSYSINDILLLTSYNFNINNVNNNKQTIAHLTKYSIKNLHSLLFNINNKDIYGNTIAHIHKYKLKELKEYNFNMYSTNNNNDTIFHIHKYSVSDLLYYLKTNNIKNKNGNTIIHNHNYSIDDLLFLSNNKIININLQNNDGNTFLHIYDILNVNKCIYDFDILFNNNKINFNPNIQNNKKETIFHINQRFVQYRLFEVIKNFNPNIQDINGNTIIHFNKINSTILKSLLKHGFNPNIQNNNGDTIMHTIKQSTSNIKLLLKYGFNPNIQNNNGDTIMHIYKCNKHEIELFINNNFNLNILNNNNKMITYYERYMEYLIDNELDVNLIIKQNTYLNINYINIYNNNIYEKIILNKNFKNNKQFSTYIYNNLHSSVTFLEWMRLLKINKNIDQRLIFNKLSYAANSMNPLTLINATKNIKTKHYLYNWIYICNSMQSNNNIINIIISNLNHDGYISHIINNIYS